MAFSRHGGFFASLQRVEERLAMEEPSPPISESMTSSSSPLVFLDHPAPSATAADSGPAALDFLTEPPNPMEGMMCGELEEEDDDDIARLMALLGLSPPRDNKIHGGDDDRAGCDCSGADGFLGKVVGVVGPKCQREKTRLDAWIRHFYDAGGSRREPARLAHLLLANKASSSFSSSSSSCAFAFPPTVKDFLDRDAPPPPRGSREPPQD